jgi:hypothetical protein
VSWVHEFAYSDLLETATVVSTGVVSELVQPTIEITSKLDSVLET